MISLEIVKPSFYFQQFVFCQQFVVVRNKLEVIIGSSFDLGLMRGRGRLRWQADSLKAVECFLQVITLSGKVSGGAA